MEVKCRDFIETLITHSEGLRAAYHETIEYWKPDEPPITTLFADLGHRIVEDFDKIDTDTNQRTFHLIESAMASGDCNLETAVATGLIEAVASMSYQRKDMWLRVAPFLGKLSRYHADAWLGLL